MRVVLKKAAPSRAPEISLKRSGAFNWANFLTTLRLTLVPVVLFLFSWGTPLSLSVAFGCFVVAGVSDFLDGYLARRYNQLTRLGRILDPLADKMLALPLLVLLVSKQVIVGMHIFPALIIFMRELLTPSLRERYLEIHHAPLPVSLLAKWKTALEFLAVGSLLLGCLPLGLSWLFFTTGFVLLWGACALGVFSLSGYVRQFFYFH